MLCDDPTVTDLAPLRYVRSITAPLSPLQARRFRDQFGLAVLNGYGQTEIGGEIVGWSGPDTQGVRRRQARLGRPAPPGRAGSSRRRGRRHAAARRGRRAVGAHARPQRRLRRRRRPRRPAQPRRLVPHRRRRPGRRRRLRVDRGPGVRHDQPRRAQGVPRGGRRGPPAVAGGGRGRGGRRRPTTGWARCRGRSSSRPIRRRPPAEDDLVALAREHLAPYKVPVRFEIIDELPRNEVGKVRAPDLVALARGVAEA